MTFTLKETEVGNSLVVQWLDSVLPLRETSVQSPVGEIRSHLLHGQKKVSNNNNKYRRQRWVGRPLGSAPRPPLEPLSSLLLEVGAAQVLGRWLSKQGLCQLLRHHLHQTGGIVLWMSLLGCEHPQGSHSSLPSRLPPPQSGSPGYVLSQCPLNSPVLPEHNCNVHLSKASSLVPST